VQTKNANKAPNIAETLPSIITTQLKELSMEYSSKCTICRMKIEEQHLTITAKIKQHISNNGTQHHLHI